MTGKYLLESFSRQRAVVVGDLMLDEYIFGSATRISQEAPVMVIKRQRVSSVPGGAANVAMNMVAMGATTSVIGVIGNDSAADELERALGISGLHQTIVLRDPKRPTTKKTRVVANHSHQVLRIDQEVETPIPDNLEAALLDHAHKCLAEADVLLISDYQKGSVPPGTIRKLIDLACSTGKKVVANAKPGTLEHYRGASVVSLNRFEATRAAGYESPISDEIAPRIATELRERHEIDAMIVTLGGSGMVAATANGTVQVPAVKVEVYDEAGAGDTVIATIALCASAGEIDRAALQLATHTAASVVRKVGVAVPTLDDLQSIARILAS